VNPDIYLYSAHIPTAWEYAVYYARVAGVLVNFYVFWCLTLNQVIRSVYVEANYLSEMWK
jgi:hypothetical protein